MRFKSILPLNSQASLPHLHSLHLPVTCAFSFSPDSTSLPSSNQDPIHSCVLSQNPSSLLTFLWRSTSPYTTLSSSSSALRPSFPFSLPLSFTLLVFPLVIPVLELELVVL